MTGTLNLLEAAVEARVRSFIFTSTTSTFGRALTPAPSDPAAWITEAITPMPKNIYGMSKTAAEELCELFHVNQRLACLILRTSRFFPEADDSAEIRQTYPDDNAKVNEYLYRRVDIEDIVAAQIRAMARAPALGFGRYIVSATTPFSVDDLAELRTAAPRVVQRLFPGFQDEYARRGWQMFPSIDRVYVNEKTRRDLGWNPRYNFGYILDQLRLGQTFRSPLSLAVGSKAPSPN